VLPRYDAAVFVHGCFWHRHPGCRYATTPASNAGFWQAKFDGNVTRDARKVADLTAAGWRVGIVWECQLRSTEGAEMVAERLARWLHGSRRRIELPARTSAA
jgi:DNA mismatch endonuclease (patch repair protein)